MFSQATGLSFFFITKTKTPTKSIRKIYMKSNYDRSKTVIRKTTKNYRPRSDYPLLLKI